MVSITSTMLLIMSFAVVEGNSINNHGNPNPSSVYFTSKMPELEFDKDYEVLKSPSKTVVIYPIFTQSAYNWKGFHDFYSGYCDSCLSIGIQDFYQKSFSASANGFRILEFLGYEIIDDIDLDQNPTILLDFDKVILLHNEFVTKTEYDAISNHPNVVYLYPNSLSSEIKVDYSNQTITLVRGPGFPDKSIENGFDWKFDNSEYLYDWECQDWKFYKINNGYMLNCYPETFLPNYGHDLLLAIKSL